jgi:hypothetical protein
MTHFNDYASLHPTSSAREESNTYQFLGKTLATEDADYESLYPTSSTREESNAYQFLDKTLATEDVDYQFDDTSIREGFKAYNFLDQTSATEDASNLGLHNTLSDRWGMFEQPGPAVSLPKAGHGKHYCNLFVDWCIMPGSPDSLAPATSYMHQIDGFGQPSYSRNHRPGVLQQPQSYHSGPPSHGFSFAGAMVPEPFTVVPTPGNGKSLFSLEPRALGYLPATDSPARPLGGKPERALYRHVPYCKS